MHKWRKFRRLAAADRQVLLQALVLLPLTAVALRLVGFRRWQVALAKLLPREYVGNAGPTEASLELAQRTVKIVEVASQHGLCRATCLEQSLVLWWLLGRRGIFANLRIGVRKAASSVEAHAWVELRGLILNDTEDVHQRYVPFDRDIAAVQGDR